MTSIQHQTGLTPGIILADDGSADQSAAICDELAFSDAGILLIHQRNAGVSAARNAGIDAADGDYIGFVDADDTIEPDMYTDLLANADKTGADVVMCDAVTVYSDGKTEVDTITQLSCDRILQKSDFTPSLLLEMAGSACRCIYSKHIYSDKQPTDCAVRFPLGVKFSEDRIFNLYAMGYANKVSYIKKPYYNRLIHSASCVMSFHEDYYERVKLAHEGTVKALREAWNDDAAYQTAYLSQFIDGALGAINNYWYKTSTLTWKKRIEKTKAICADEELSEAILHTKNGVRERWISDKRIYLLSSYAFCANQKHRR